MILFGRTREKQRPINEPILIDGDNLFFFALGMSESRVTLRGHTFSQFYSTDSLTHIQSKKRNDSPTKVFAYRLA
jgi:hypothetical protein